MTFAEALQNVAQLLEGAYAECGVYRGDSAVYIQQFLPKDSRLYLFDTFQGHPYHGELDHADHPAGRYSDANLSEVRERFRCDKRITVIPGRFEDVLSEVSRQRFCFVNLDCDLYQSYKTCLSFFLSRMVPRGIIRVDDYRDQSCPGCKKAVDELLDERFDGREFIQF